MYLLLNDDGSFKKNTLYRVNLNSSNTAFYYGQISGTTFSGCTSLDLSKIPNLFGGAASNADVGDDSTSYCD